MAKPLLIKQADQLVQAYQAARTRQLFLDYDGTLVDFAPIPSQAVPTPQLLATLAALTNDPKNTVVIVSGRDRQSLDTWFGHLPLGLSAEHGYFAKPAGGKWESAEDDAAHWKQPTKLLLQALADTIPKSFIEEKQTALCWHYRQADQKAAAGAVPELLKTLAGRNLQVMAGDKVIEVRNTAISKASALSLWAPDTPDFMLVAGDDTTDESMFMAAPPGAVTIKIRPGITQAQYVLQTPKHMLALMARLAAAKTLY
jgi:trehalose 6-phosphate synthase/phosphatase